MESGTWLSYWSTRTVNCHQLYCSSLSISVTRTFCLLRTAGVTVACLGYVDVCLSVWVTPLTLPVCQSELHISTDQGLSIILVSIIEQHFWENTQFYFLHLKLDPFFSTFINVKIRVEYILITGTSRITFRNSIISSIFCIHICRLKHDQQILTHLHCIWHHVYVYVHTILLHSSTSLLENSGEIKQPANCIFQHQGTIKTRYTASPDTVPPSSSDHTSLWTEILCYIAFPSTATLDITPPTAMNKQWRLWNILRPTEEYDMKIRTSYMLPVSSFRRRSSIFNTLTCLAQASTDEAGKWEMDS